MSLHRHGKAGITASIVLPSSHSSTKLFVTATATATALVLSGPASKTPKQGCQTPAPHPAQCNTHSSLYQTSLTDPSRRSRTSGTASAQKKKTPLIPSGYLPTYLRTRAPSHCSRRAASPQRRQQPLLHPSPSRQSCTHPPPRHHAATQPNPTTASPRLAAGKSTDNQVSPPRRTPANA